MSLALLEPSFADHLIAIEGATDLAVDRKRHWACSLRQIAKALDRPPQTIPARWTAVRSAIKRLHHAMTGSTEKTLQNHKANVRRALSWVTGQNDAPRWGVPLTSQWSALRQGIADSHLRNRITPLMRYCSGTAISPEQVNEAVLDGYMAYRAATSSLDVDATARRRIVRAWNRCVDEVEGWPAQRLIEPPFKSMGGPTWEEFPEGLRKDIEDYLSGMSRMRRGARGTRIRPSKPSTIRTRRAELVALTKRAATLVPLASIDRMQALLSPDLVGQVLDSYWAQDGERPGTYTINLGWRLLGIARLVGGFTPAELDRLDEIRAALETYRKTGLTPKNLALIRQVLSGDVWSRVVRLPWALMREARTLGDHAPMKAALAAQLAVAIAILSVAPVRLGNLGKTQVGENLIKPGGVDTPYWLVFADYDVKNDVPLQFQLDQERSELIDEYIHDFRPALLRGSNQPWLFLGEKGGHKQLSVLATQISKRICRATGIRMTPHQFRHAAAAILLKHRPGEYELVRRLLGHRNVETTKNFYCGLETTQATEIYDKIIRDQLRSTPEKV